MPEVLPPPQKKKKKKTFMLIKSTGEMKLDNMVSGISVILKAKWPEISRNNMVPWGLVLIPGYL